jgi:hypothetical protein
LLMDRAGTKSRSWGIQPKVLRALRSRDIQIRFGYFDDGTRTLEPIDNPFRPTVYPCSRYEQREWRVEVLFVAPARANRKQAHSNPSWLERYDAAVLQGVHELG